MRKGIRKNFKHYLMLLPFFFFYTVIFSLSDLHGVQYQLVQMG